MSTARGHCQPQQAMGEATDSNEVEMRECAPLGCISVSAGQIQRLRMTLGADSKLSHRSSQDLPLIGLWQLGSEIHVLRHLVSRERLAAVLDDVLFGERRVLAHHEQRDD